MDLDTAIKHSLDGNALLFLGAGFSSDKATLNARKAPLLTGQRLSTHLLEFSGLRGVTPEHAPPLEKAAEYCRRKFQVNAEPLVAELRALFTISACAEWQRKLLGCNWSRIYTTNYDDLAEFARSQAESTSSRPKLKPVLPWTDPSEQSDRANLCVHLNGYIHAVTSSNLDTTFKLSSASYADSSVTAGKWGRMLRSDVVAARAVFFVGYSLYDLDLRRLLNEVPELTNKTFFVIGKPSDPAAAVLRAEIEWYGQDTGKTAEDLANLLSARARHYLPPTIERRIFSFPAITMPEALVDHVSDTSLSDLLVWGQIDRTLLWSAVVLPEIGYCVRRTHLQRAFDDIINAAGDIIVHADLGNGKTVFVEMLALLLAQTGISVHRFESAKSYEEDIKRLCLFDDRRVVLIENFLDYKSEVSSLLAQRRQNILIIATTRTPEYQVRDSEWFFTSGNTAIEYDLNILDAKEIEVLDNLLERPGLWREQAYLGSHARQQNVREIYSSQFQIVVLELLRSKEMEQRLKAYLDFESIDNSTHQLIAAAFISNVLGFRFSLYDLAELCDIRISSNRNVTSSAVFGRVFDRDTNQIKARSAIIAKHCLTRLLDASVVASTLESFIRVCNDLQGTNSLYKELLLQLSQFRNITKLLPANFEKESLYRYFEVLRSLGRGGDPLFWLQYAIARMFTRDLEHADQYFQTAYSLAGARSGYNAFQIDNHYARYLVEAAIETYDPKFAANAFLKAREIIERQMAERSNRHYPYRVASKLYDFYLVYNRQMADAERQTFFAAADRILKRAQALDPQLQQHPDVRRCIRALTQISKQAIGEDQPPIGPTNGESQRAVRTNNH
jgi:hypothetical protein